MPLRASYPRLGRHPRATIGLPRGFGPKVGFERASEADSVDIRPDCQSRASPRVKILRSEPRKARRNAPDRAGRPTMPRAFEPSPRNVSCKVSDSQPQDFAPPGSGARRDGAVSALEWAAGKAPNPRSKHVFFYPNQPFGGRAGSLENVKLPSRFRSLGAQYPHPPHVDLHKDVSDFGRDSEK